MLRDIDAILDGSSDLMDLENHALMRSFTLRVVWNEKANKAVRAFDMNRDGFALVVMATRARRRWASSSATSTNSTEFCAPAN